MRAIVMLMLLLIAGTCHAEDPLETLNTVEDTLSTMERVLNAKAEGRAEDSVEFGAARSGAPAVQELSGPEAYFVSDEPLGARGWVSVRPCPRDGRPGQAALGEQSCADATGEAGGYFWQSREASAAELRPGVAVISQREKEGTWFLARVTDVSQLSGGYVTVSAPFKVQVKGLRMVED